MPIMFIFRTRHTGSSSTCDSSVTLDAGLERPDPLDDDDDDDGDVERGECVYTLRRLKRRYSVFRFTHVPPNSSVTTTSGSMNAPAPMVLECMQVHYKWLVGKDA
jgi:hypothetical protein